MDTNLSLDICFICLKTEQNLTNVNPDTSESESHIIQKLKNFVPELVSPIWYKKVVASKNIGKCKSVNQSVCYNIVTLKH